MYKNSFILAATLDTDIHHSKHSINLALPTLVPVPVSVNTPAAYQSLKLDCMGILVVKICVFKVCDNDKILCYLYYHVTVMYCSN